MFVHTTYKNFLKLGKPNDNCDELFLHEDMLFYNGVYYGDWSVFTERTLNDNKHQATEFEQSKAALPPTQKE